jgi:hypothetical protein
VSAGPAWVPPWLGHLRRDKRGIPVPYINRWGPQKDYTVRWDDNAGMYGVFDEDDFDGAPDFLKQSVHRQRECTIRGLCQVCARPVPWSRRYLVLSSISVERVDIEGRMVETFTEPWLDQRCAELAIDRCPGLIRRKRDEDLALVPVARADCLLILSTGWVDGPAHEESLRLHPAMWAKVAFTRPMDVRVTRRGAEPRKDRS